jgi:hypothetical protein
MSKRIAGNIAKLGAACAFSALIVASSHARADDTTSALLDVLKAKGAITQTEYDKIKARQQAEAKDSTQKLQAAEARAREAEAKANEAKAKANEAEAKAKSDSAASEAEIAKAKAETLTAADMPVPMKAASPVNYVTVLPNCVGIRVGEVDICTKGDVSFFGVEDFNDKNPNPPSVDGGASHADLKNSNSIRGGLLPSSFQVSLATHQAGLDIGVYVGIYTGGNNAFTGGSFNANSGGSPFGLGTAGIDFRQFYGTIGTPTWGTVKIGRDIGLFGSDAILNDLTLLGVGSPGGNFAPGDTSLGRIGVGYLYADFIPQITYRSPTIGGFTAYVGAFTPFAPLSLDGPFGTSAETGLGTQTSNGWNNSDLPMFQGKLSWVNTFGDAKLTLSTSGLWQRQQADCSGLSISSAGFCEGGAGLFGPGDTQIAFLDPNKTVNTWAVDGFAMLDWWGWNFVAYGYTSKGVGLEGLMWNGIDAVGDARRGTGGYFQAAYTFNGVFTVGGSWGISHLETANANDQLAINTNCGVFNGDQTANTGQNCLVRDNSSWIGFARYKLTKWVNLQAEYIATTTENQLGQTIKDNAVAVGTTFFW